MTENNQRDLLEYYKSELDYLRTMGSLFAQRYPKVASRLELSGDISPDPQVERLLEAFAFLTGRIQHQLDSQFPEITSALLGILYPQLMNPVPSMAIAHFAVDPEQGQLTTGYRIGKNTTLFAHSPQGLTCRFRTCYPVTLWPLQVVEAGFESTDQFRFLDNVPDVSTVLRLKLEASGVALPELSLKQLRFYLHGDRAVVSSLYELLFCHVEQVVLLPTHGAQPIPLREGCIQPAGFGRDDDVLPYPRHAHRGYRLLQEYFSFPQKFEFFDLHHLDQRGSVETLDILILLRESPTVPLRVDRHTFALGCTPIVNLFRKTTEPIRLDHRKTEYRLIPDLRRERTTEIHSIRSVSASSDTEDETRRLEPFFSFNHHMERSKHKAFWHAARRRSTLPSVPGTEIHLSFLDLDFKLTSPPDQVVFAHTLCTNRGLAEQLSVGAQLQIEEAAPLIGISCLTKPTPQLSPPLGGATLWRLISHLSLNHLSLSEGKDSLQALREILKLYCFADRSFDEKQILGIREMSCRNVVRHVGSEAWRGFCRGIEVTLLFDPDMYVGSSSFLFAAVLNHFVALYASVNSFTQLVVRSRQREGIWKKWPPMAGEKIIL